MAEVITDFLYLLDQRGSSPNGKVVRELVPDSTATSSEEVDDGTLMVSEDFITVFTNDGIQLEQDGTRPSKIPISRKLPSEKVRQANPRDATS